MPYFRVHLQDPVTRSLTGNMVVVADFKSREPIGERNQKFWVFKAGDVTVLTITSIMVAKIEQCVLL